jgi:hypothetical protein
LHCSVRLPHLRTLGAWLLAVHSVQIWPVSPERVLR